MAELKISVELFKELSKSAGELSKILEDSKKIKSQKRFSYKDLERSGEEFSRASEDLKNIKEKIEIPPDVRELSGECGACGACGYCGITPTPDAEIAILIAVAVVA